MCHICAGKHERNTRAHTRTYTYTRTRTHTFSRVYAQYFGGDMDIRSIEGFGTDCYLFLNRYAVPGQSGLPTFACMRVHVNRVHMRSRTHARMHARTDARTCSQHMPAQHTHTHAPAPLTRLGENCENLPPLVMQSPAARDSTLPEPGSDGTTVYRSSNQSTMQEIYNSDSTWSRPVDDVAVKVFTLRK